MLISFFSDDLFFFNLFVKILSEKWNYNQRESGYQSARPETAAIRFASVYKHIFQLIIAMAF
jgi:hypothetical protein